MSENAVTNTHTNDIAKDGGEILTFYIEDQMYGIDISYITDIIEIQPITYIPRVPYYIKGVINLRGKVIPVINVRTRFDKPEIQYDARTSIIVIDLNNMATGLIIDSVSEVERIAPSQIAPPPTNKNVNTNKFISHIVNQKDKVCLILDCQKIIMDK